MLKRCRVGDLMRAQRYARERRLTVDAIEGATLDLDVVGLLKIESSPYDRGSIAGTRVRTGPCRTGMRTSTSSAPVATRSVALCAPRRRVCGGVDWAVLVRQCLRRLTSERPRPNRRDSTKPAQQLLRKVDVHQELDGTLRAEPYQPTWVADLGDQSVDFPSMGTSGPDHPVTGEPWLRQLMGKDSWKSAAQRDVVWRALNSRPNSTLLVGLPTGSGKSLVYQCCAAFEQSMTVVVVPTIALGLDQLAAVRELPCAQALGPVLYHTGGRSRECLGRRAVEDAVDF